MRHAAVVRQACSRRNAEVRRKGFTAHMEIRGLQMEQIMKKGTARNNKELQIELLAMLKFAVP
jgi:hypothetical protein